MSRQTKKVKSSRDPEVSVIIPCRNSSQTLRATLDSLLAQEFGNWEAIIVDDGSKDDTRDIIKSYMAADQRFSTMEADGVGPSAARNLAGLKRARGQYIAFLDSDDLWMPQKLGLSVDLLNRNLDIAGAYAQISFFRKNSNAPETYSTVYKSKLQPIDFLRDNPVCTTSNLVLRTAAFRKLKGFNEAIVHNEDVELLVRCTASGADIDGIDRHLVCYRTSLTGLSADLQKMRGGWYAALETLQSTPFKLSPAEIAKADAGNLRYLARRALRTGAPGFEALRFALAGISRSPLSFLTPGWRGGMTLLGAIVAPFIPTPVRSILFSR